MASGPGKMTIGDEVAVEWTLIQVAATSLSMPSCSLAGILQESGSSSGAKDVQRDVATYATGQKGDEEAAAATLLDCASIMHALCVDFELDRSECYRFECAAFVSCGFSDRV